MLVEPLIAALDRSELVDEAAGALAAYGNHIIPDIERHLRDDRTSQEIRRELPTVLVRIGTARGGAGAHREPAAGRRHAAPSRHRVAQQAAHAAPRSPISIRPPSTCCSPRRSPGTTGRIRSSGRCKRPSQGRRSRPAGDAPRDGPGARPHLPADGAAAAVRRASRRLRRSRVRPTSSSARTRSSCSTTCSTRSCASCSCRCSTRRCRPTSGSRWPTASSARRSTPPSRPSRRCCRARIRGCRSSAIYAVGALQLRSLEGELTRFDNDADPLLKQSVRAARRRLRGEPVTPEVHEPTPAAMGLGVGTG